MSRNEIISSPSAFIGMDDNGIISFGSGQPDLPPPKQIFENLNLPRPLKYGVVQGEERLRKLLADEYRNSKASDFVITNGASEALDLVFRAIFQIHGKVNVLICSPYYYSYPPIVSLAGHTAVYTRLRDGKIDLEEFKSMIKHVKVVIINSPSNPTGRVEELATLREIEKITSEQGAYIVTDEVYRDLIYGRENYLIQGDNVITINSFSKTYSMCGIRVGYLYSRDPAITKSVIEIKIHTSMNTSILSQEMAIQAMKVPREFISSQTAIWIERRDCLYEGLLKMGFDLWKPEGAFYVLPRIRNSAEVVTELFYEKRVIVYDGTWFGAPDRIRLSYALDLAKIKVGLARIKEYISGKENWLL